MLASRSAPRSAGIGYRRVIDLPVAATLEGERPGTAFSVSVSKESVLTRSTRGR